MVCQDFGQPDGEVIDGITVWKTYRVQAGLPIVRFVYPRVYSIWRALSRANADVYFQSCAGVTTGLVALFADRNSRRMIFRIAHDTDCIPGQQLIKYRRDKLIYEYGLRTTDLISAQSRYQADLLMENYKRRAVEVNMVVEAPSRLKQDERVIDVLWVNNIRDFKRPDIVCEIARKLPSVRFVMIGGEVAGYENLYEKIKEETSTIENLEFLGAVPYSEVNSYFSKSKLFLNTSDSEGFPNSYLQAWIREVPVVSFFDPDSIIETHGFGASPSSFDGMNRSLIYLLSRDTERKSIGVKTAEFVRRSYSPSVIVSKYEKLLGIL